MNLQTVRAVLTTQWRNHCWGSYGDLLEDVHGGQRFVEAVVDELAGDHLAHAQALAAQAEAGYQRRRADTDVQILGINFEEDGVSISYVSVPADLHENGMMLQRNLTVPATKDTKDDVLDLHDAVVRQLLDWLEDYENSHPKVKDEPEDDDEDGMGWGERR